MYTRSVKENDKHKGAEKPVSIPMEFEDAVAALLKAPKDNAEKSLRGKKKPPAKKKRA